MMQDFELAMVGVALGVAGIAIIFALLFSMIFGKQAKQFRDVEDRYRAAEDRFVHIHPCGFCGVLQCDADCKQAKAEGYISTY